MLKNLLRVGTLVISIIATSQYTDKSNWGILKNLTAEDPRPPVILIPGLVSSRLIAWKKKNCRGPDIEAQQIVWLNLQKMVETMTFDPHCWIDCMKLGKNGSDPPDCKLRADEGLSAIGELSPGNLYTPPATSVFTFLIKMLADELGYDVNTIIGAPYDWRLPPTILEQRDSFFTTLKFRLETSVRRHRKPAIVMAHSMGNLLFFYFVDWLRYIDKPGIGYKHWLDKHVWGYVGFAAPMLGAPIALKSVISGHTFGLTITEAQSRELHLACPVTHFLNPRSSSLRSQTSLKTSSFSAFSQPSSGYDAAGDARRVEKDNNRDKEGVDFFEPLISVRSASGSSRVSFGIKDIENGEMFRWLGNMCREGAMLEKYEALNELYMKDPLRPLERRYERPPVRHVLMVYGVDLPTEVAYSYVVQEGANNTGTPVLDELVYESSQCNVHQKEAASNVNRSPAPSPSTSSSERMENETAGESSGREHVFNDVEVEDSESDVWDSADTCELGASENGLISSGIATPNVTRGEVMRLLNRYEIPNSSDASFADGDIKVKQVAKRVAANGDGKCDVEFEEDCPAFTELYTVSRVSGQKKKTFLKRSDLSHSGDSTVPYLSLSFVHSWLFEAAAAPSSQSANLKSNPSHKDARGGPRSSTAASSKTRHRNVDTKTMQHTSTQQHVARRWNESRPAIVRKNPLDGWSPIKLSGSSTIVYPAVDFFYSNNAVGDTMSIIEVSGVDHLDIAKHHYVLEKVFEYLLPKFEADLLRNPEIDASKQNSRSRGRKVPPGPPAAAAENLKKRLIASLRSAMPAYLSTPALARMIDYAFSLGDIIVGIVGGSTLMRRVITAMGRLLSTLADIGEYIVVSFADLSLLD